MDNVEMVEKVVKIEKIKEPKKKIGLVANCLEIEKKVEAKKVEFIAKMDAMEENATKKYNDFYDEMQKSKKSMDYKAYGTFAQRVSE